MTKDNTLLGTFQLSDIPPMPRGQPQIEVVFDVDSNGILNVSASEKSSGKSEKITIKNDKGRLTPEEIERMVQDAEKFKEQDEEQRQTIESKNGLESYLYEVKQKVEKEFKDKITEDETKEILDKVAELDTWLISHPSESKTVYDEKKNELVPVFSALMKKVVDANGGVPPGAPGASPFGGGGGGMPEMQKPDFTGMSNDDPDTVFMEPKIDDVD